MQHLNINVFGSVQGVFYRTSAKGAAEKLGISGFARNEPDGSVYIEAEGDGDDLKKFLDWCKKGPDAAEVKKLETEEGQLKNFPEFSIL